MALISQYIGAKTTWEHPERILLELAAKSTDGSLPTCEKTLMASSPPLLFFFLGAAWLT